MAKVRGPAQQEPRTHRVHARPTRTASPPPRSSGYEHYPKTKYRRAAVSDRHPHGYEAIQVIDAADEAALDAGWVDHPNEV